MNAKPVNRIDFIFAVAMAILIAIILFSASKAKADLPHGTPLFTCSFPTQNVDGSPVGTISALTFYMDGSTTAKKTFSNPANCGWQTVVGDISPGSHTMVATVSTAAGGESAQSNVVPFVIPNPAPKSPTGLSVQ